MKKIDFKKAYYIKLGRGGKWEESSMSGNKLRLGWSSQTLEDINGCKWNTIKKQLDNEFQDKGAATRDLNALRYICDSSHEDVWITFYSSRLWWCRVGERQIHEDKISKYRRLQSGWSDRDVEGNVLLIHEIPGTISKTQGFRGTACRVKEVEDLKKTLNNTKSEEHLAVYEAREKLKQTLIEAIRKLHWKDFEVLVDLIFRQSGWQRRTALGETMKFVDLELEDPITKDKYQVQVKSKSSLSEFKKYEKYFSDENFRKLYYVVHTPEKSLAKHLPKKENVHLILPPNIAEMTVSLGMVDWVLNKI